MEVITRVLAVHFTKMYAGCESRVLEHSEEWVIRSVSIMAVEAAVGYWSAEWRVIREVDMMRKRTGYWRRSEAAFQAMWERRMLRMTGLARMARIRIHRKEVIPSTARGIKMYDDEV